jgi:hypothetical protein
MKFIELEHLGTLLSINTAHIASFGALVPLKSVHTKSYIVLDDGSRYELKQTYEDLYKLIIGERL